MAISAYGPAGGSAGRAEVTSCTRIRQPPSGAGMVAPWMWRNQVALGTMQLTQRGAESLWERALEDQMERARYEGAFFLWARPGPVQRWLGRWGHFSPSDAQVGGSLVRLNSEFESPASTLDLPATWEGRPDKAVTFFRQGIAENVRLENWYASHGAPHPDIAAEKALYRKRST